MATNPKWYMKLYRRKNGNYKKYHRTPVEVKKHNNRYKARRMMGDPKWMHVDHKNWNALDNRKSNLQILSPKANLTKPKRRIVKRKRLYKKKSK